MKPHHKAFRLTVITTAIAMSLMTAGCGGAFDIDSTISDASLGNSSTVAKSALNLSEAGLRTGNSTTSPPSTTSTSTSLIAPLTTSLAASSISGPLIQRSNIVYQGVFALPSGNSSPSYSQTDLGSSRFGYGADSMATYRDPVTGKINLFISGHAQNPGHVAQVEVPASFVNSSTYSYPSLPVARLVQKFRDITNGDLSSPTSSLGYDSNGASPRGFLPHNGKLIFSAVNWYSYTQNASHGASGINFTADQTWSGFTAPTGSVTPIRAIAGAMSATPVDWQESLGSPALTGASSVAIISAASYGPALNGFDPSTIGRGSTFAANALLFYPKSAPVCGAVGCDNTDNPIFNWGSQVRGFAAVSGSNSILFVGTHGIGGYWYGGMLGPNGMQELPENQWQGPHSTAYEYRVWAYRASDLALVKAGQLQPWDVKPYAIFPLDELTRADRSGRIASAAYDQASGLLFVATAFGENPRLHVYKINLN